MPEPLAFLSYTRTDDEFFGGYITEFRKVLEKGVHVVTGKRSFRIFQDIEGIVIGENWKKKLTEVINSSSFFVPMLSPLFFNSGPCRDETAQFLAHERSLDRDDLILPIYFVETPTLEKESEKAKDTLATEFGERQIYDWREQAEVPLQDPASRKAIMKLAGDIGKAMTRLGARRARRTRSLGNLAPDPSLLEGMASDVRRERVRERTILWVDDRPDNNIWERHALEPYGVRFELAVSTDEAEQRVREKGPFAAIISDIGRPEDSQAGFTLLSKLREAKDQAPYFIYTTARAAAGLGPVARLKGAEGITSNPDQLVKMVLTAID